MNSYWLIGIYLLIIASIFGIARCFKTYKIDAKPLTQQTLFWLAILIPIVSFIYFGLFAWWGKTPVFSAHGFERFIKISTLPLGLLSLAIPFTAVINNIHRTVQTNEQINQAKKKNDFDLFYSHRKNFIDYISSRNQEVFTITVRKYFSATDYTEKKLEYRVKPANPYLIYKKIYNINDTEIPSINASYLNNLNKIWKVINNKLEDFEYFKSNKSSESDKAFEIIEENISEIIKILEIEIQSEKHQRIIYNSDNKEKYSLIISNSHLRYLISALYDLSSELYIYTDYSFVNLDFVNKFINSPSFDIFYLRPTYINNKHRINVFDYEEKHIGHVV
ncbi:hypothetical protein AB6H97_002712 [Providencia rettgeri]